jgi:hypothetical protein
MTQSFDQNSLVDIGEDDVQPPANIKINLGQLIEESNKSINENLQVSLNIDRNKDETVIYNNQEGSRGSMIESEKAKVEKHMFVNNTL